jgi:hypothetical protein
VYNAVGQGNKNGKKGDTAPRPNNIVDAEPQALNNNDQVTRFQIDLLLLLVV